MAERIQFVRGCERHRIYSEEQDLKWRPESGRAAGTCRDWGSGEETENRR